MPRKLAPGAFRRKRRDAKFGEMLFQDDTIFALSSGRPPAAVAVIRISGPRASTALKTMIGRIPPERRGVLARIRHPHTGELIDEALALWFPGPRSETGEDMAELQVHGGRAVIADVLQALGELPGFRPAEAGEFTRRAFARGRLDLTAVEGLADLVAAETRAQRRQALSHMRGLLGSQAVRWREALVKARALVEAGIDFADEGDVPENVQAPAVAMARQLAVEIGAAVQGAARGERLRDGLVVAIAGAPNVGKSSLLNRLARREAAIVSAIPGTTRDVIEVQLDLEGYPVTVLDTAGIRETGDPIEMEGVRRARERAGAADLVLWMVDVTAEKENRAAGHPTDSLADDSVAEPAMATWVVMNKVDVASMRPESKPEERRFAISALSGEGVETLMAALAAFAKDYFNAGEPMLVTRERQRYALMATREALLRAAAEAEAGQDDLFAEELRIATMALDRLLGRVDVEDILDVIFRDFCIGK